MSETNLPASSGRRKIILLGILLLILLCLGVNASIVKAVLDRSDYPNLINRTDSDLLQRTDVTRYYYRMAWHYMDELTDISNDMTIVEILQGVRVFDLWMPNFRALLDEKGDSEAVTEEEVRALTDILGLYADRGSPSFRKDIQREMERLQPETFIGLTMTQAWERLHEIWSGDDPTVFPFLSDPEGLSPQPHGELLTDDFFGQFWRAFRVPEHDFAFAYPMDWIVYAQAERAGSSRRFTVCNYDERVFVPDRLYASINCSRLDVLVETDRNATLADAAREAFCPTEGVLRCREVEHLEEGGRFPERIALETTRTDISFAGRYTVAFRLPSGELMGFSIEKSRKNNREFLAMLDSFIPTSDGTVFAPEIIPWEPEPWPQIFKPRVELIFTLTPHPSPQPWPTPLPLTVRTPQATLEEGEFASSWASYRDAEDGYGFAYPAEWVFQSTWTYHSARENSPRNDFISICSSFADLSEQHGTTPACVFINEYTSPGPKPSYAEGVEEVILLFSKSFSAEKIYIPAADGRPERTEIIFIPLDINETYPMHSYVFQCVNGKMIWISHHLQLSGITEIEALVDSFILGNDTPIIAPSFEPSNDY